MRHSNQGFSYLIVLFAVAALGAGLAAAGIVWEKAATREKEIELLYAGNAYRNAIASYYERTPGGVKNFPKSLEDLLKDPRAPNTVRHLRRMYKDPVTGSLNAALAQWLIESGRAPRRYVAAQGTALGRAGRVFVEHDGQDVWIGGHVAPCIEGTVAL